MSNMQTLTLKTANVTDALTSYAKEQGLTLKECDFFLKKVDTYVKDVSHKDFTLVQKEILTNYLSTDKILNEHIEFSQLYTINLHPKKNTLLTLIYKVHTGNYTFAPKIIISPKSLLPITKLTPQEMLVALFKELNKIKMLHGFIINILDSAMKEKLKIFIKHLYANKFTKNIQITLFSGIEPLISRQSKLIYWYKEKDLSSQINEVEKDEILIEYKKPKFGKNGLNAYGREITTSTKNNMSNEDISFDSQTILLTEDSNSILYKSKLQGFVHFKNNKLSIDNKVTLSSISRNNTSIASEEDNSIEIVVSQHDANKDSIGEGVELVSELIHVDGFVGSKSKLEATHLHIDGATHQDSFQLAKFATINRHKGKLRCHEAKINLLEGGEVIASKVEVESALGGTIYAIDVIVGHVKNNLKIYASNSITIRLISGEENSLTIDYTQVPVLLSKLNFLADDINNLKEDLEHARKYKPKDVDSIKTRMKEIQAQEDAIKDSYKKATISIQNPLQGLNKIKFVINKEHEILFKTDAISYETFSLQISDTEITLLPVQQSIKIN